MMTFKNTPDSQCGAILLEGLIAILIFSMGILAMVGMQAASIKNSADAKYRADASYLANQIIGQIWANRLNAGTYACSPCYKSGAGNADTQAWATQILGDTTATPVVAPALPGGIAPTIAVAGQQITVTVFWQSPQETTPHNFVSTAQIGG